MKIAIESPDKLKPWKTLTSDGINLQVYTEECSKLESVLSTVEQIIKRLFADYDSKKKVSYNN